MKNLSSPGRESLARDSRYDHPLFWFDPSILVTLGLL